MRHLFLVLDNMKNGLFLLFFLTSFIIKAELSDGEPRYTIQVLSEPSYSKASSKMSEFRKYGYTFVYEKILKRCNNEEINCSDQKTYRVYLSIFKNKDSSTKQKLGYINSILANYCLKLSCKNKMKRYGYKIDILFHADEIIKRKLSRNNYTIFDNNKIFNCNKCDLMELY